MLTWWYRKARDRAVTTKQRCLRLMPNPLLDSLIESSVLFCSGAEEKQAIPVLDSEHSKDPTKLGRSLSMSDGKYGAETTSVTLSSSKVLIGDFAC